MKTKWTITKPLFVTPKDKRYKKYAGQIKRRGFSDEETWNLDNVTAEFLLPRLRRFKEINNGYPPDLTPRKWNQALDDMIFAFDWNRTCDSDANARLSKRQTQFRWKRHAKGLALFAKYFRFLWW